MRSHHLHCAHGSNFYDVHPERLCAFRADLQLYANGRVDSDLFDLDDFLGCSGTPQNPKSFRNELLDRTHPQAFDSQGTQDCRNAYRNRYLCHHRLVRRRVGYEITRLHAVDSLAADEMDVCSSSLQRLFHDALRLERFDPYSSEPLLPRLIIYLLK